MKSAARILFVFGLVFATSSYAQVCQDGITYDADASVFDSGTVADPGNGVYPVGGSGIGNGNFAVCDHPGVQIAGRISERFVGPIAPAAGTADYTAPIGESSPGLAKWNIEGHIDFGFAIGDGGAFPESVADVGLVVQVDCNPYIDVIDGPVLPAVMTPANGVLLQFSQNIGFDFLCGNYGAGFDPNADGHYAFVLTLTDGDPQNSTVISQLQVNAIVGNPVNSPKISADGMIESRLEGFRFPDGTVQTTAAVTTPPPTQPGTYIVSVVNNTSGGLAFAACNAGDQIIGGGGRCFNGAFGIDRMHKSCPANAAGACLDGGGTSFETWAAQCDTSEVYAYAVCLDLTP